MKVGQDCVSYNKNMVQPPEVNCHLQWSFRTSRSSYTSFSGLGRFCGRFLLILQALCRASVMVSPTHSASSACDWSEFIKIKSGQYK